MKKHITTLSLILSLAMGSGLLTADTIRMKDGTTLDCDIIAEDAEFYTVSVNVTKTIKDERKIAKADVASIDKASPADEAFELISGLIPTPDLQTVADYDRMINRQVNAFLEAFPSSPHTQKAKEIKAGLEKERMLVEQGGLKLDQKWISPSDRLANAYELDARIALDSAEQAAERGDLVGALRILDTIHSDYTGAKGYDKAVELSKKVLAAHKAKVTTDYKRVDDLIKERKVELTKLTSNQRDAALSEIKKKEAAYMMMLKKERDAGFRWPRISIYHKEPMTETIRTADAELRRMDSIDLSAITPAGPIYRSAWAAAVGGQKSEAESLFAQLRSLKVPDSYITQLEEQLPSPEDEGGKPGPTTTEEDPGDGEEDAAMEEEKATEADGPKTSNGTSSEEKTEATTDETTESKGDSASAQDDQGSGMTTILLIVIGVVIVIAIGAVFAGGKKKK